jgi:colanic acid biosynthesis glycosyl transferase WcaI
MNILILTDSYPPEIRSAAELMKDLAEGLAAKGDKVTVVTSRPYHNTAGATAELGFDESQNGVRIIRPKVLPHHNVPYWIRGLATIALPYIFYRAVKRTMQDIDVVIVHSPPLPLGLTASWIKNRFNARFILNLHDIFPQHAVDLGVLSPGPALKFFEWMERRIYKRADLIVTPSSEHAAYIENNRAVPGAKVRVIPHWLDMAPFERAINQGRFRKQFGLENKFVFMFAGVHGPSQGLEMILEIAGKFQHENEVRFLFVGEGREKPRLMELAEEKGLLNVAFKPLVATKDYPELVKEMNVGFITLTAKNTTPAVPAKLMGYMAGGLPVLALLHPQSEALKIVEEANCGYGAVSDNPERALELAKKMYAEKDQLPALGRNGYEYAKKHFERNVCVEQWREVLAR